MSEMSNHLEDNMLDHILRGDTGGTSFPQPTTVYLALYISNPTDTGTGGTEVSGGSYARKLLSFGAAASGVSLNTTTANYTNMPTADVTHIALWDALTAGNMLFYSSITLIEFNSGDEATVAVGAISVELQ